MTLFAVLNTAVVVWVLFFNEPTEPCFTDTCVGCIEDCLR